MVKCKEGKYLSAGDFEEHARECTMCANDIEIDEVEWKWKK